MRKALLLVSLFAFSSLFWVSSCKKDDSTSSNGNNNGTGSTVKTARDSAIDDYNQNYLGSEITSTGWTGSVSTCTAGSVSQASRDAVIKRINYFRRRVGLNDNCTLDPSLYVQEQETALMMTANNTLSHTPPSSWTCYTAAGSTGAGSSNLALGTNTSGAVTAFINDYGTGNTACGHRRWILHSTKQQFSFGSTDNAMALYVFASGTNTTIPAYIAWPPKGYVPQSLIFGRWSFSIPGANFGSATVTMTGPSGNVSLIQDPVANGYGDNTLVWEPTGVITNSTTDVTYTVTVSGITGATQSSYTYNVVIIKP